MMSLYDYLGRAAGSELGQRVAAAATQNKVKIEKEKFRLQKALFALNQDLTTFQAGISRDTKSQKDELLVEMKRVQKKVDVVRRDIINSLPTQIRKTIGHIEFARPLDNNHGRG